MGRGKQALIYLGRYLYRGVLLEKDILFEQNRNITFRYKESSRAIKTRTLSGAEFLWLLLQYVLLRGFRRVRDFGFLHSNCKQLIQLLQILFRVVLPRHKPKKACTSVLCQHCGNAMTIIAMGIRLPEQLLC